MLTTTQRDINANVTSGRARVMTTDDDLLKRYDALIKEKRLNWSVYHRLFRRLGEGGQGVVYLTERRGADGFTLPVAVKIFSPERFPNAREYEESMSQIARVGAMVAQIQQDNLLNVENFIERDRVRMMVMEWVDGYDLRRLLDNEMLQKIEHRVSVRRWEYINRVIATTGPEQTYIKPGVAVAIVRGCLAALAALHRDEIVHGDIKPSNIMLKRTGTAKLIDIGSAFKLENPPPLRTCTPTYAAPEVLEGAENTPRSDLASLGYVLIEMLAGRKPFEGKTSYAELLEAKRALPQRLHELLPEEVSCNHLLMSFCRSLIAPDPMRRFANAEAADLLQEGAAAFQRQLVKGDMSSEYENEIRLWIEELKEMDDIADFPLDPPTL